MRYKCIIFDCDGILVDTEAISVKVLMELAKPLGLELDYENAVQVFTGLSLIKCFEFIEERVVVPLPKDIEPEFRKRTFELFNKELKAIDGIHDVVSSLKIPFCVASSGPQNKIAMNLKLTNLYTYFEGNIFSCFDLGKWKPDPAVFLHAAKTMGFKPEECVVIEDSVHGVEAAISGGFEVFGFANSRSEESLKNAGAKVFYQMKDLLALLEAE
ncbi:HAD family hydrolase [Flavicella sediminum]|uniref:HAD family hydrolase n=1 Tax=Flavicella sediminum TaxID=2585141 RepID=UPI0011243933|nr:HAD family hydrolase [Flavicella sediminum]